MTQVRSSHISIHFTISCGAPDMYVLCMRHIQNITVVFFPTIFAGEARAAPSMAGPSRDTPMPRSKKTGQPTHARSHEDIAGHHSKRVSWDACMRVPTDMAHYPAHQESTFAMDPLLLTIQDHDCGQHGHTCSMFDSELARYILRTIARNDCSVIDACELTNAWLKASAPHAEWVPSAVAICLTVLAGHESPRGPVHFTDIIMDDKLASTYGWMRCLRAVTWGNLTDIGAEIKE
jgi:hypothetical protein